MAYWGPDGRRLWARGPAGLGCLTLLGTAEQRHERLPFEDPDSGMVFTAGARLDDRDDLCDALGVRAADRETTPDTTLLLRWWLRQGEGGLARLRGDWSFALWDPQTRRLVLARDPYGQSALYYSEAAGRFAFASSQKALLALPWVSRDHDDLRLAQVLTSWDGDGTATAFRAIRRLPPAHLLRWENGTVQVRRYYRMEDAPDVRLSSDGEYVEVFLDLYARAVRSRLRSARPAASTLSGGLDSGSVTALAAREMEKRNERLIAFTSVPLHPPDGAGANRFGDEWPLAHATAALWPAIEHVAVRAADHTPLDGIERQIWMNEEPGPATSNFFWIAALLEAARERGIGTILTGQIGNGGVSWGGDPNRIWRQLAAGDPAGALRELAACRRVEGLSWIRAVRSHVLYPFLAPIWVRRHRLGHPFMKPWDLWSAIHPEFARRIRLGRLMREAGYDPYCVRYPTPRAERLSMLEPAGSIVGAIWHEAGAAYGLEVRDPTADLRLLEFCLGIPDRLFGREGRDRWLIRRAMEGLLPPEVQWNRRRGRQAADLGHRLRAEAGRCRSWLDAMERSPACRERLALPRMRRVLLALERRVDPTTTVEAISILCRGLGVGRFLAPDAARRAETLEKKGLRNGFDRPIFPPVSATEWNQEASWTTGKPGNAQS